MILQVERFCGATVLYGGIETLEYWHNQKQPRTKSIGDMRHYDGNLVSIECYRHDRGELPDNIDDGTMVTLTYPSGRKMTVWTNGDAWLLNDDGAQIRQISMKLNFIKSDDV